jgi:hypothetical protein
MVDESKMLTVESNRLLYDEETLSDVRDALAEEDVAPKATEIKRNVKTSATVYEIRTALTFWFGGRMSHRESDRVWSNCEAFENGEWALNSENEIIPADTLN